MSSINRIRRVIEVVITGLTRNQVIPNGTEGSNPSLSAKNKGYSVCYTLYFFVDKTARDSNPYNLLQDEVLSKEVYNRIVCGANSRANEVSRVPHSPPKKQDIAKAMSCFCFKLKRDSNPYNLLQDEVLSKEVYNRIVCGANSRANEVSRVPHSPPKKQDIAKAMSCFCIFVVCEQAVIKAAEYTVFGCR